MTKGTERVNTAIDTTKTYLSDYFRTTCQMRLTWAEVVYTFHPGVPVALDRNDMIPERNGQTLTVTEVKALGFTTANLVKAL